MSRASFEADGFVRLPAVIAAADAAAMRAAVERLLKRIALVAVAAALRPGPGWRELLCDAGRGRAVAHSHSGLGGAVGGRGGRERYTGD